MPDPEPDEPRKRPWRARLVALGLSLAVGGFVAELFARARWGAPLPERLPLGRVEANPHRGWQMIPGEDHYTYEHHVSVNALGLRGAEVPESKAPGERRVLVLGDSMVYGQGVADAATLPAHLEAILNETAASGPGAAGLRWRVVNGGHRAYATNQELGLLEELGARLAPDAVLLLWYDNDFEEFDIPATCADLERSGPRTFDVGAALEGRVLWSWRFKQVVRRSALAMIVHDRVRDAIEEPKDEAFYAEGFARLEDRLARFVELCDARGARPLLAVIPTAGSVRGPGPSADRAARVEAAARRRGVEVVELLPGLRELLNELGRLPVLPYDGHYLGVANRRMAEVLAPVLAAP